MFLNVIASQLRGGRNLVAIFRDLRMDENKHIRKLATDAESPENPYFATRMPHHLGTHKANLLVLAQRYNALEPFITHLVNHKKPYNFFRSFILRYIVEWFMLGVFIASAIAMYLYADFLQNAFGDFSESLLYDCGRFLVTFQFPVYMSLAAFALLYAYFADNPHPVRKQLTKLGFYVFRDNDYLIELLTTFHLLTQSAHSAGVAVNTPELIRQLAGIYGGGPPTDSTYLRVSRNKVREEHFHVIQDHLSRGRSLRDALALARLLPSSEMSLYRGITPRNTIEEHSRAAKMVLDQLTVKTEIKMRRTSASVGFFLYSALGFGMIFMLDVLAGGATNMMELMGGAPGQ